MSLHFDESVDKIEKWYPKKPLTAIYFDPERQRYFLKRFVVENTNREDSFVVNKGELIYYCSDWKPFLRIIFEKPRGKDPIPNLEVDVENFISVKGFKAQGNLLTKKKIKRVELINSSKYEEIEQTNPLEIDVLNDETVNASDDTSQITLDI